MRRLALFGATVLVPCALLVIFGFLLIRQDRELAARHADDQRRVLAAQQRQTRLARLERIKAEAAEAYFAGRQPAVDFAALVVAGAAPAPWSSIERPGALDACERAEFTPGALAAAIDCYARRISAAAPLEAAWCRLLLGRALLHTPDDARRRQTDRDLLATPFDLSDDQGVPFAFYAADRLLPDPTVDRRLHDGNAAAAALSAPAAYLLQNIARRLADPALLLDAAAAVDRANASDALRAGLPGLLPALRAGGPEPVWLEHGPWLVGLARAPESGKELVLGIAANRLPPQLPPPLSPELASRTGIYVASLGLVFLIAASGAYLLWRDVRRDVEIAALRSQFVSSVSHELKTPLTAIRMFAETLRLRPAGDFPREEYLDTIVHESERLSRLVDNVLDFSKIEQGRKLYRLRPTSVTAILDAVVRVVRYPVEAAGLDLRVVADDSLPQLQADPDALQQAVLNLLANAIKYSSRGNEIQLAARAENGAVVIAVRDYGVGIAPEHRQRIFERFYRVPSPENRHVPGAGLGLTLVAHIAAAHGGAVTVESAPGAGSIFSLRLPLEQRA